MRKKTLSETNPYIKDLERRKKLIERSVMSSCAVEGIQVDFSQMKNIHIPSRGSKKIYQSINR